MNKKVLVVGAGATGVATANFLANLGVEVVLNDKNEISHKLPLNRKVKFIDNGHDEKSFKEAELIVVSPGVNVKELKWTEGKDIVGDVEIFGWFDESKVVAITGTNGKTTTTFLTGEILKRKYNVFVGGNIGTPVLMRFQPFEEYDFSVLELSSFQLETIDRFYADIAVILNITPDHLNRYENYKEYENAKLNLLKNQKKSQILILNKEIESLKSMEFMGNVLFFGKDSVADNNFIKINFEEKELSLDIQKIPLKGKHFYEDIYVAGLIGLMNGVDIEDIKDVVYNFRGLEHRMEFVTSVNGVDYFNDSKSTTVSSTCRGVESFENQVVLILGGVYKGETFKKLDKYRNVKKIICFGEASDIISEELKSHSPVVVENLEKAVEYASRIACKGDIVLFSPACASFDMFENYIERGNTFKEFVKKI